MPEGHLNSDFGVGCSVFILKNVWKSQKQSKNTTPFADTIKLDTVPPTGSVVINNNDTYTKSTGVTLTINATDATSGVAQMCVSSTSACTAWEPYSAIPKVWTLTTGDGDKTVNVWFRDTAGNENTIPFSDVIKLDTTPPTGTVVINNNSLYINTTSATLTISATDAASGVAQMCLSNTNTCTAWEPYSATPKPWTLTTGDGEKTVNVWFKDNAGNENTTPFAFTITLDTVPPTGSVVINNNDTYTKSTGVTLTINATDATSGVAQMCVSNTNTCTDWEAYATTKPWTLATGDGDKTVNVWFKDNAGNENTTPVADTIKLDTIPPAGSVVISNNDTYTKSTGVTLTINATDATSGVAQMCVSSTSACTAWEPYSAIPKAWTLTTGDGDKTVNIWFKDNACNENTTPFSDTIILDTAVPDTAITSKPADPTNITSASFGFSSTESGSTFECKLDDGSFEVCNGPKTYSGLSDGQHTFSVRATDMAGNTDTTPESYTWTIDTVKPSSTIVPALNSTALIASEYTFEGTASDIGSHVEKVEISVNGGAWTVASGTSSWTYAWTIPADGTYTLKSRATDAAGNVETPGDGLTITAYKRQASTVSVSGRQLLVNGNAFTVKGVGYSPVPIGSDPETGPPHGDYLTSNYSGIYNRDLPLLRAMGANAIRLWSWTGNADHHDFLDKAYNSGTAPIYIIAGFWINAGRNIDPNSPENERQQIEDEFRQMVLVHKNHPAILMWAIGNELNASWMYGDKLTNLFSLIEELAQVAHEEDGNHPVTTPLADTDLINTITAYNSTVPSLDMWGANIYRGKTFGTLFNDYKAVSSKPLVILEYGIDTYDNVNNDEYDNTDIPAQSDYAEALWKEIEAHSDVCTGGTIMEYSDEWWKGKFSTDEGCPDNDPAFQGICGYASTAHPDEYANEEWWGIMRPAKNGNSPDTVEPRLAYYALQSLWLNPQGTFLRVIYPESGTELRAGSHVKVRWLYSGNEGTDVKINILKGGKIKGTIIAATPIGNSGIGTFDWIVPAKQAPGSDYRIKITNTKNKNILDAGDGDFTINAPTLKVEAANGGERWLAGLTYPIKWKYTGNPGPVKIKLLQGGKVKTTIAAKAPVGSNGAGTYNWTIPVKQAPGSGYQIRITGTVNKTVTDTSDGSFTIDPPTITVGLPHGNENWITGSTQTITWTYTGDPGLVKETISRLRKDFPPSRVKVLIGGGPIDETVRRFVRADAIGMDAAKALEICHQFVKAHN